MTKHHTILCLGDSYTVGEGVAIFESYPYQLLQVLRLHQLHFHAPEIVAKTGWTTFELADHLLHHPPDLHYDFVTVLIGVNNQYRGLDLQQFKDEFNYLLKKALHYNSQLPARVLVFSIPDWSVTPFANDLERAVIAGEIDAYNMVCKTISEHYHIPFFEITTMQRQHGAAPEFLAADQLHPSAVEYARWADLAARYIQNEIERNKP